MITLVPLATIAPDAVEALLDHAFGTERRERTAYKVREGLAPISTLSFAAVRSAQLVGTIQCWPVALHCDEARQVPMVMVGPVAVEPDCQQGGIGRRLMQRAIDAAAETRITGSDALMLVGDPEYYGRFFGFSAERTGKWRLPGPFEQRRLLARGSGVPAASGMIGPRSATKA